MKVHIYPSMRRITISTSPYLLDPLGIKVAVRYLSFRSIIFGLLFTAFFLPFAFIFTALMSLEGISECRSMDCLYRGRRLGPYGEGTAPIETNLDKSPIAPAGALTHSSIRRRLDREAPDSVEQLTALTKSQHYDAPTVIMKLKSMVEAGEEEVRVAKLQRALYRHFASKAIPKGLHCLSLRLTAEHLLNPEARKTIPEPSLQPRLVDNDLYHFVLITDNVFAASVVVRSAVNNTQHPEKYVFHIVTDKMSYAAMHTWFALSPPSPAVVEVLGVHQFDWLNKDTVPVLELMENSEILKRHYFGDQGMEANTTDTPSLLAAKLAARNPKYISIMNHLRMYLPQVFPQLNKVVFLDDDVVVQRDLAPLWEIPLHGRVMGAVETCQGEDKKVMSKRFKSYLNFSNPLIAASFNPEKCAWAYGMNILDLAMWRQSDITHVYNYWQRKNMEASLSLWRLGTLPPSLIAFDKYMEPINPSWHMLGLGYQPESDLDAIRSSAVIHYNGAAKPWLELAIPEFRPFWSRYVNYSNDFVHQCNIFDF